jgi:hypothetical protein
MLLFVPPTIDIDIDSTVTQVKHEIFCEYNALSTCFDKAYRVMPDDINLLNWSNSNVFSSNLKLENIEDDINSTWEENDVNEFDLVSNVKFSNTIKIKSRIKTISKYKPNIIID